MASITRSVVKMGAPVRMAMATASLVRTSRSVSASELLRCITAENTPSLKSWIYT